MIFLLIHSLFVRVKYKWAEKPLTQLQLCGFQSDIMNWLTRAKFNENMSLEIYQMDLTNYGIMEL